MSLLILVVIYDFSKSQPFGNHPHIVFLQNQLPDESIQTQQINHTSQCPKLLDFAILSFKYICIS